MRGFLNPDNVVMQFITKLAIAVYLNILWFLCCLPLFTVGASTTALFYVTLKMAKNEEGNITKAFFSSFKANFRQGTIIWLILLGLGILLGADGYVLYHMRFENAFWAVCTAIFIVVLAVYAILLMYIFPLLARFHNTTLNMFKNSLVIGIRFFLCTIFMAVIYFIMAFVIINVLTPAIIFGEGLCAFLCSYLLSNVLLMCQEKAENTEPTEAKAEIETEQE